jgi:serine/threonine-protein kinase
MSASGGKRARIFGNLHEGDVFAGKFRIERLLGAGGMGFVVAATRIEDGSPAALKILHPQGSGQEDFAELQAHRLVREAHALDILHDEHIVRTFAASALEDGTWFLEMELLEGADLYRVVRKQRGPLPVAEAAGHLLEACQGVANAHARGIIHRDLKPQNLFLAQRQGQKPTVKVLDFGVSKLTGDASDGVALTATGTTLGSPEYMSIEQLMSARRVDHRTDIWALGMCLYFLLSGHTAFEAPSLATTILKVTTEDPTPLRKHRPDAPEAVEALITRCLEKDLPRRTPSVLALAEELAPFAAPEARGAVDRIRQYRAER